MIKNRGERFGRPMTSFLKPLLARYNACHHHSSRRDNDYSKHYKIIIAKSVQQRITSVLVTCNDSIIILNTLCVVPFPVKMQILCSYN